MMNEEERALYEKISKKVAATDTVEYWKQRAEYWQEIAERTRERNSKLESVVYGVSEALRGMWD